MKTIIDLLLDKPLKSIDNPKGKHILIGNILIKKGFVPEETVRTLFKLKADAKKRFVINPEFLPENNGNTKPVSDYEKELKALKEENQALKKTMAKIVNAVKTYDI